MVSNTGPHRKKPCTNSGGTIRLRHSLEPHWEAASPCRLDDRPVFYKVLSVWRETCDATLGRLAHRVGLHIICFDGFVRPIREVLDRKPNLGLIFRIHGRSSLSSTTRHHQRPQLTIHDCVECDASASDPIYLLKTPLRHTLGSTLHVQDNYYIICLGSSLEISRYSSRTRMRIITCCVYGGVPESE